MKIHEQSQPLVKQSYICQNLCIHDRRNDVNCLQFHDDFILNKEIHSVSAIKLHVTENNRNGFLSFGVQPWAVISAARHSS